MKRSLSAMLTGERVPHPDDEAAREALDLLILADGPWTEQRLATASPHVVAARKWVEFVRRLMPLATQDLEALREQLDDASRDLGATTDAKRRSLAKTRLSREAARLSEAFDKRALVRAALLLDEDTDGES